MKKIIYSTLYFTLLIFISNINLQAQETPTKWRFVANIQDAYRINYPLSYGSESNYPHHTGWSLGFDRLVRNKNNWEFRIGLGLTKQNILYSNNRYWNLFEKPILKRDNQYYASFPISLTSNKGRRLNTFFQIEPTFNLNEGSDIFVNFMPGLDYKLNRYTKLYFSHGLQIRNFFNTSHNETNWHSQLGLKINLKK